MSEETIGPVRILTLTHIDEAIRANLIVHLEYDDSEWMVLFEEQDGEHGWYGVDKDIIRAVKKTYCQWKQIYFDDEID